MRGAPGLDLGAGCNLFYLDLGQPNVFVALPTPSNQVGYAKTALQTGPIPSLMELWGQAGCLDSSSNRLKLTNALRVAAGRGIVPAATSYTTGGPFNVWTAAAKGMPYIRYDY